MDNLHSVLIIAAVALVTIALRFLPFSLLILHAQQAMGLLTALRATSHQCDTKSSPHAASVCEEPPGDFLDQ